MYNYLYSLRIYAANVIIILRNQNS